MSAASWQCSMSSHNVVAAGNFTIHHVDLSDCAQVCILVWKRPNGILLPDQETQNCHHQSHNHVTITVHPGDHLCCGGDCRCTAPIQHQDCRRFQPGSTWPQSVQRSTLLFPLSKPALMACICPFVTCVIRTCTCVACAHNFCSVLQHTTSVKKSNTYCAHLHPTSILQPASQASMHWTSMTRSEVNLWLLLRHSSMQLHHLPKHHRLAALPMYISSQTATV